MAKMNNGCCYQHLYYRYSMEVNSKVWWVGCSLTGVIVTKIWNIYLHSGCVCYWRDMSSFGPDSGSTGHLAVGEAAHSCCVSEQFLDFLPWLCPPLLEQPGLGCCVSVCWDAVWTKAGSLPEELKSTRRRAKLFQFPTYMIQLTSS